MTKIYVLAIFLLFPLYLCGQEDICIGKEYKMYSAVLQEERVYWVHLPKEYNLDETSTYPVVYLLDGESFFHSLVGICKTLTSGRGRYLPPSILVGVISTERARDFTPTASAAGRDGKIAVNSVSEGGGAEAFNSFLTSELRSAIETTYRTNGSNTLVGHSYAGLFTLNTFLCHTGLFDYYLAVDPSLWWDNGKLVEESNSLISGKDFSGKRLYIGFSTKKRTDRTDIHQLKVNAFLSEILPQAASLHFYSKSFPEENHGTVALPGIYDGIKQLFGK